MERRSNRRRFLKGLGATTVGLAAVAPASAAGRQTTYLVASRGNGASRQIERAGYTIQNEIPAANVQIVAGPNGAEADLRGIRGVQSAAKDIAYKKEKSPAEAQATDSAAYADRQWDKHITDAFEAHKIATGEGTRLAIMDTGVDADHPDLTDNVNADLGRSFIDGEVGTDSSPVHPHGTHTAGIAGATGDKGIVGMAPDTELVPLRVFPKEGPLLEKMSDCLLALSYAAEIDADAVNISLGWSPRPPQENQTSRGVRRVLVKRVVQSALKRGTSVIVSAGNSDFDLQHGGYRVMWTSLSNTFAVSATGPDDALSYYSNYGTSDIDVAAPGGGYGTAEKTVSDDTEWPYPTNAVLSTVPDDSYAYFQGTSMAAPQVTGLVGLVKELAPNLNSHRVQKVIERNAELSRGKSSPEFGAGRINALDTVESLS